MLNRQSPGVAVGTHPGAPSTIQVAHGQPDELEIVGVPEGNHVRMVGTTPLVHDLKVRVRSCACVRLCVCVRAFVRACACVRARVCAPVSVCVYVYVRLCAGAGVCKFVCV